MQPIIGRKPHWRQKLQEQINMAHLFLHSIWDDIVQDVDQGYFRCYLFQERASDCTLQQSGVKYNTVK